VINFQSSFVIVSGLIYIYLIDRGSCKREERKLDLELENECPKTFSGIKVKQSAIKYRMEWFDER